MNLGHARGRPSKWEMPEGYKSQADLANLLGVSRRTVQRHVQRATHDAMMREFRSNSPELDWEKKKRNEQPRIDLLAARAAVRRVANAREEFDGLYPDEWALLREIYVEIQRLLYPEEGVT